MKKIWFNNGIIEKLIDENEIVSDEFKRGRLPKPKKIDELLKNISKEDLFKYYIIDNHSFIETVKWFNIEPNGMLNKLLKIYDIHKDPKMAAKNNKYKRSHEEYVRLGQKSSETQKFNWKYKKSDEEKALWSQMRKYQMLNRTEDEKNHQIQKMINTNLNKSQEEKDLINERRSKSCKIAWSNPELQTKARETARINRLKRNNFCRSTEEQLIYDSLIQIYPDLQYDVKVNDSYPYYVDFYIPSEDIFIEYQGHPSHGKLPYDANDENALNEAYKLYGNWLYTYTKRDVEKLKVARENSVNLVRIYPGVSVEKNIEINEFKNQKIIKQISNLIPIMK